MRSFVAVVLGSVSAAAVVAGLWSRDSGSKAWRHDGSAGFGDLVSVRPAPVVVPAQGLGVAMIEIEPKNGYFVYGDGIVMSASGDAPLHLGKPELPEGEMVPSDEPGLTRMRYGEPFSLTLPVDASAAVDGLYHVPVDVLLRLCSPQGCQPVRTGEVELVVAVGDAGSSTP